MQTTVANKHVLDRKNPNWEQDPDYLYIGRRPGTQLHFGNPFSHLPNSAAQYHAPSREMAVRYFKEWLAGKCWTHVEQGRRDWILKNLHQLKGKVLVCFCYPKACHGEVYADLLNGK